MVDDTAPCYTYAVSRSKSHTHNRRCVCLEMYLFEVCPTRTVVRVSRGHVRTGGESLNVYLYQDEPPVLGERVG